MQCFTYKNKVPKTVLWRSFQPPEAKYYHKRPPFLAEPNKIGRPYCPDLEPFPKDMESKTLLYNPPLHASHREKNMGVMLDHINRTNWTTGQDASLMGRRKSRVSESVHYSLQSTSRSDYRGHKLTTPDRIHPNRTFPIGITPCTYPPPYRAVKDHPYTVCSFFPEMAMDDDPNKRCKMVTVPLEIPAPFPGPLPKIPHVISTGDDSRHMVNSMGLVP